MGTLVAILCILGMITPVIVLWIIGIDYMKENHPDYKGEDFLDCGEDDCVTKMAGRDAWDDNNIHSEGDF